MKNNIAMSGGPKTPRRHEADTMQDRQIPWTEQIARHRPRAPIRRLSASEESGPFRSFAQQQQPAFTNRIRNDEYKAVSENDRKHSSFPASTSRPTKISDALELDPGSGSFGPNRASTFPDNGSSLGFRGPYNSGNMNLAPKSCANLTNNKGHQEAIETRSILSAIRPCALLTR